jgi:hypothetical protein
VRSARTGACDQRRYDKALDEAVVKNAEGGQERCEAYCTAFQLS